MLDAVLAITVVAAVASGAHLAVWRSSARVQQAVLYVGLLSALLAPVTARWLRQFDWGLLPEAAIAEVDVDPVSPAVDVSTPGKSRTARTPAADARPVRATNVTEPAATIDWRLWLGVLWGLGTVGLVARLAFGQAWLWRFRARLQPVTNPRLARAIARIRAEHEAVAVRTSSVVDAPLTLGWRRPVIVMPEDVGTEHSTADLVAVLHHELAHIREGHHRLRPLQSLVRASLWWHPLILWLEASLRRAQENVCDDAVVAVTGDGRSYARCLVAFAERSTRPAVAPAGLVLFSTGGELAHRVRALIREERAMIQRLQVRHVAGLLCFATLCGAAQACLSPQGRPPKANAMTPWLPLAPGAFWKFRIKQEFDRAPAKTVQWKWHCLRSVDAEGGPAWEVRTQRHRATSWAYWRVSGDGIFRHAGTIGGFRRIPHRSPICIIPGPLGVTTRWKWQEVGSVQTAFGAQPPSDAALTKSFEGRIVAMAEAVRVPAGTFQAARIEITQESPYFGKSKETLWLAKGVGIVKRVEENFGRRKRVYTTELESYTKGNANAADEKTAVRVALAPFLAKRGQPKSVTRLKDRYLDEGVVSSFHLARWKEGFPVVLRFYAGKASRFRAGEEDWRRLIAEERLEMDQAGGVALTKAYGVLWAHVGSATFGPRPRGTEIKVRDDDDFDVKAWVHGKAPNGRKIRGFAQMSFKAGTLSSIQSNLVPQQAVILDQPTGRGR